MEPHTTFGGIFLLAIRQQMSVIAITQALVVALITAAVTSFATVTRVDARMVELIADVKEIKAEHGHIRERLTRVETRTEPPARPTPRTAAQ